LIFSERPLSLFDPRKPTVSNRPIAVNIERAIGDPSGRNLRNR